MDTRTEFAIILIGIVLGIAAMLFFGIRAILELLA